MLRVALEQILLQVHPVVPRRALCRLRVRYGQEILEQNQDQLDHLLMLLSPSLLLAACCQMLYEHTDAFLLDQQLLVPPQVLQHRLPVLREPVGPAVLFRLICRLDLLADVRELC